MNKFLLGLLIAGCASVAIGGTVVAVAAITNSTNGNGAFANANAVTNEHVLEDSFENIDIDVTTAAITINKATDGVNKVVCVDTEDVYHEVKVENNTLSVKYKDEREWYEKIGFFNFNKLKVDAYLTEDAYSKLNIDVNTGTVTVDSGFTFSTINAENNTGSIKIKSNVTGDLLVETDTGSIEIENNTADEVKAKTDTGSIKLTNVTINKCVSLQSDTGSIKLNKVECENIIIENSTGSVTLTDTIASGSIGITTTTGGITFEKADAATLNLKASTGSIKGTFLTPKIFSCTSSTGKVTYPVSTTGGICIAQTSTGAITLSIVG